MDCELTGNLRKTGIRFMGDVPWGTHICGFYETGQEYMELLVPYIKTGLENNEYCMWVLSDPVSLSKATTALAEAVPNFEQFAAQIEILTHNEWYLQSGSFQEDRILEGWKRKADYALSQGYAGLRLAGSPAQPGHAHRKVFFQYEDSVEELINSLHMIALCPYQLSDCTIPEIIRLVASHQFAFIKSENDWKYANKLARFDRVQTLGTMAAGVVHEIRNPMTSVRALMQLLQTKEEFHNYSNLFGRIIDEMDRVNEIITEYLSLGTEKDKDLKPQDLNSIVSALLPLIEAEAERSGKSVLVRTGDIEQILVDHREIRQVILNLARNGLEAMDRGGTLEISTLMKPRGVALEIKDGGSGIPEEVLGNLGKPFLTTKQHGTGLGLYVSLRILESYNAQVQVNSSPEGTTFSVFFPSAEGAKQEYA